MEEVELTGFLAMARDAGLRRKGMYTLREVSQASGVAYTTLIEEASTGRLTTFLPPGRARGRLVKPEWFDAWMEAGTREAVGW